MTSERTYNYPAYSWDLEENELARWLADGARTGETAPDFGLADLDGTTVRLSDLRGRPVVIEFGSYSCPIFSDRVPAMERLAREHPDVSFLVIAIREAHPGELLPQHRTATEKRSAARKLAIEEGIGRRVLVDDLEGTVHRAYGGAWNPVYVLDAEGKVAFRRAWNHPDDVAAVLAALVGSPLPAAGTAREGVVPSTESIEMAQLSGRQPMGLRLLERGGRQALLDFYQGAPPPVRRRLEESPSAAVRNALKEEVK